MEQNILQNKLGKIPHPLVYANPDGFVGWMDMTDPELLLNYYRFGLFPWENYDHQGAFFFPQKRYLIKPKEIKIAKSIRPYFNKGKFEVTMDEAFLEVMLSCKQVRRKNQGGTWISNQFVELYLELHKMGYAHSLEVWQDDKLIGGLYGVATGKIFTGESMFSLTSNASRFALISLAMFLDRKDFKYIDCQLKNHYLEQFGGFEMDAPDFLDVMKGNFMEEGLLGSWSQQFSMLNSLQ